MSKLIGGVFMGAVVLALVFGLISAAGGQSDSSKSNVLGENGANSGCATIQSGTLKNSANEVITTGYDKWGYNYQALNFNGKYCDSYRNAAWCQEYKDVNLQMKWNEAWLSNKDCGIDGVSGDPDGKLDRHLGFASYRGSGAWLTNHQSGKYENDKGKTCNWTYFVKIVAAPSGASNSGGIWYGVDGKEIGHVIWGDFAVIEEISNDPCGGGHGVLYKGEAPKGFGVYKP